MQTRRLLTSALVLALAACASSTPATTTTPATASSAGGEHHEGHHGGGDHHASMPPTVVAFHDVLRPLWHSDAGADRDRRTCEQAATLQQRAQAIADAAPPAEVQPRMSRWTTSSAQLVAASQSLVTGCAATPPATIGGNLEAVHTAFHNVMEAFSGEEHH